MGYYTNFELSWIWPPEKFSYEEEAEIENFVSESENYGFYDAYDDNGESLKWYDWKEDMKGFSKKYPETLFTLIGKGEESGDLWKAYFKDGKMQLVEAQITYEKFDLEKLE